MLEDDAADDKYAAEELSVEDPVGEILAIDIPTTSTPDSVLPVVEVHQDSPPEHAPVKASTNDILQTISNNVIEPVKRTIFDRQFFIQAFSNFQYQNPPPALIVHSTKEVMCTCETCTADGDYQAAFEHDHAPPEELVLSSDTEVNDDSEGEVIRPPNRRSAFLESQHATAESQQQLQQPEHQQQRRPEQRREQDPEEHFFRPRNQHSRNSDRFRPRHRNRRRQYSEYFVLR